MLWWPHVVQKKGAKNEIVYIRFLRKWDVRLVLAARDFFCGYPRKDGARIWR